MLIITRWYQDPKNKAEVQRTFDLVHEMVTTGKVFGDDSKTPPKGRKGSHR